MTRPPLACALSLLAAWPCAGFAQSVWSVDDSGGADFTDVQTAIDAAAPGDVLRILPGHYAPAVLDKALRLIGDAPPPGTDVPMLSDLDVTSVDGFTLANLRVGHLAITGTLVLSEIDDCTIGPSSAFAALEVTDAADLVISRSEILGGKTTSFAGTIGLHVESSRVQVVDSLVRGADVHASTSHAQVLSGWGGTAVFVRGMTTLLISGSDLIGGYGEDFDDFGEFDPGHGGAALFAHTFTGPSQIVVDVRGAGSNEFRGGLGNVDESTAFDGAAFHYTGACGTGLGQGQLLGDGVTFVGAVSPCAAAHPATRPRVSLVGDGGPGNAWTIDMYGPSGAVAVLGMSLESTGLTTPLVATTPLWIDPAGLVVLAPMVLAGARTPTGLPIVQPLDPLLAGLRVYVQGFELLPTGTLVGSNVQPVILRF